MMETRQACNLWASQYDTDNNKIRDLEAQALRTSLAGLLLITASKLAAKQGKIRYGLLKRLNT